MDHARRRADINKPMQELPPFAAKSGDPLPGGGDCQRNHQNETRRTRSNEGPLNHVLDNVGNRERLVQQKIRH